MPKGDAYFDKFFPSAPCPKKPRVAIAQEEAAAIVKASPIVPALPLPLPPIGPADLNQTTAEWRGDVCVVLNDLLQRYVESQKELVKVRSMVEASFQRNDQLHAAYLELCMRVRVTENSAASPESSAIAAKNFSEWAKKDQLFCEATHLYGMPTPGMLNMDELEAEIRQAD